MTYAEMIQKGLITFPTTVDDALKSTIYDWFQYREVCDDTKFNVMFNRVLNQSMRKYNELLRIQPGQPFTVDNVIHYVNYDWLIQNYKESLATGSVSGSTSGTKTLERTGGGQDTETTRTQGTVVTDKDTTDGNTRTFNETTRTDIDRDTSASNTKTYNERTQTDIDRDISNSSSSSGSSSDNDMSLGKASPQSVSYAGATSGMPSHLDWSYPGSQAESKSTGTTSDTSSGSSSEDTDQDTIHTGTVSDSGTGTEDVDQTVTHTGTVTDAGAGTDDTTVTHNLTVTKTIQHGLDDTDEETSSGTHAEESENKILESGRNIDTATLLQNAKEFILGSSAWDYLYGRIDTCFQGVTLEW